jgi:hypothetical protein
VGDHGPTSDFLPATAPTLLTDGAEAKCRLSFRVIGVKGVGADMV